MIGDRVIGEFMGDRRSGDRRSHWVIGEVRMKAPFA
jgi:hypothetical protein